MSAPREDGWEELRRLAEAATPGPWQMDGSGDFDWFVAETTNADGYQVWARQPVNPATTAAYIAAVSPDVVLRLLAAARGEPPEPGPAIDALLALQGAIEGQNLYYGRYGTTPAGRGAAQALRAGLRERGYVVVPTATEPADGPGETT